MACNWADQDLLMYSHGEMSWLRALLLRAHLRRCERCQKGVAGWEQVSGALRTHLAPPTRLSSSVGQARRSQLPKTLLLVGLTLIALTAAVYSYVSSVPKAINCDPAPTQTAPSSQPTQRGGQTAPVR